MTMFTLLFAVFAAAGEMSTADPYLLCVKNQGKSLASIKENGFHLFLAVLDDLAEDVEAELDFVDVERDERLGFCG